MSERIVNNMSIFGVECLVVIGGDGSLFYATELAKKGIKIVQIPKTIDNDVGVTDMSVGFMTAVETATEAIDKLHTTAESHHRVMILEVMGRYAGWIALYSGLAGGADIILIPEIPYDIMKVAHKVLERRNAGKSFSIIVVSEAARTIGGDYIGEEHAIEGGSVFRLSGIGNKIADDIENVTKIETRVTVLGHLQRGGRPIPFDRVLATRLGAAAVELVSKGDFGKIVCMRCNEVQTSTLEEANAFKKPVDPTGEIVRIARNVGVSFGD
jgi:6-phosphofructokinase 1